MGFHEVRFPTGISEGSSGGPGFSTAIVETDGGQIHTVARWAEERRTFDASASVQSYEDLNDIAAFYRARRGCANGFRFKDWSDYHSSVNDPSYRGAIGTRDQVIGVGDGTTTQFQLKKTYTSGPSSGTYTVRKPVSGTVLIWVNSMAVLSGWTVDTTTGIVTFSVAPTSTHVIEASFEYDVPVMFAKAIDDVLSMSIDDFDSGSIGSIPLVELVDPEPGNVGEFFYGGAYEAVFSANMTLSTGTARLYVLSTSTASLSVLCPDPASIPMGGPLFYVINGGATTFTLKDHLGTTLATLAAGKGCAVVLTAGAASAKIWYAIPGA